MGNRNVHILSLDGGGIRGVFTAAFLAHVEHHLKVRLVEHLDLLTGTSTGAILGLALASGMSADETLAAYKEAGPLIFGSGRSSLVRLFKTAHGNEALVAWLQRTFQGKTLDEARTRIAIPTFEAETGTVRVWKGNHHRDLHAGGSKKMWEVALASAAAPTYLPAVSIEGLGAYLDGGLWANNPALVGIIEAKRYLEADFPSMRLVSIGTGRQRLRFPLDKIRSRGQLAWARDVIELQFAAQSDAAHQQARLLLGEEHYLRIDEDLPHPMALDDVREIATLEHLGREVGLRRLKEVERMLRR